MICKFYIVFFSGWCKCVGVFGGSRVGKSPHMHSPIIQAAEKLLLNLRALDPQPPSLCSSNPPQLSISHLGRLMSHFPVAPRYSKMLALGRQEGCLPYVIAVVAALSVKEIFVEDEPHTLDDQVRL